jgi:hypothetical protein
MRKLMKIKTMLRHAKALPLDAPKISLYEK